MMGNAVPLPGGDVQERAMRLAELGSEEMTTAPAQLFLNGGIPGIFGNAPFGNGWGNGFGNGGFRNGGFRNGGFRNAPRFRNGGFRNFR
jgi:rSAM-associated Gly-rich repeat protein